MSRVSRVLGLHNNVKRYAVVTDNPNLVFRLKKKYRNNIKTIIIIVEAERPHGLNTLGQKYNIKIKKMDDENPFLIVF